MIRNLNILNIFFKTKKALLHLFMWVSQNDVQNSFIINVHKHRHLIALVRQPKNKDMIIKWLWNNPDVKTKSTRSFIGQNHPQTAKGRLL